MRIVIGEDEVLMREGIRHIVEQDGHEVVASVGTAVELEREVTRHRPDLVITDIRMPPTHTDEGLVAALHIKRSTPEVAVVVLSQYVQSRYASELLEENAGGVGYLLKQRIADVKTFLADLRRVAAGGTALDPEVVTKLLSRASQVSDVVKSLTPRQVEVLGLMGEGRSNAAIASKLYLSQKAVVLHVSHIYDAFGLPVNADDHRRVLAVLKMLSMSVNSGETP